MLKSLVAFGLLLAIVSPLMGETLVGRVVKVSDGDTITVLDDAKVQHKIRLNKIDAPEKKQDYGEVSRKYLAGLVTNGTVKVEWEKKDKYGRTLGVVFSSDGKECNLEMVKAGLAWHYRHFDKTAEYENAEVEARQKKVGLWKDPSPIPPWEFRKRRRGGN